MDLLQVKANMEKRGFEVKIFETSKEAADYLVDSIKNTTVGSGGSMTLEALDIYDRLCTSNTVFWRSKCKTEQDTISSVIAPVYLTSANGVSENGDLVNIDGAGNRVSATSFGKERLIYVIGKNKIVPTAEDAVYRARNIAAPLNTRRLNKNTPCAVKSDKCYNCSSPDRICNVVSITENKLSTIKKLEVIIINENLGF